jgi:DNA-binding PadR family transcriptional regulator
VPSTRITYPTAVVLAALSRGCRYGFEIMDTTGLASGTVYPILRRLEEARMLSARWERAADAHDEQRPPRRYYQITGTGRQAVRDAMARFPALSGIRPPGATPSPT